LGAVVAAVLRTSDRITGLKGLAGSGKTTALREMVAACKEAKIEPLFCAPTAAAMMFSARKDLRQ